MPKPPRLTPAQKKGLLYAWSPDFVLEPSDEPGWGTSSRTVKSLAAKGLIQAAEAEDEWDTTPAGAEALGVLPGKPPKTFAAALARFAPVFVDTSSIDLRRRATGARFSGDDVQKDFAGALTVIDLSDDDSYGDDDLEPELLWSCVARAISEAGFPCTADCDGDVVVFWPEEEE